MARPKTKTNAQVHNDYAKKAYDDIRLQVKKGQKDVIRAYAESQGMSLQGFINYAIDKAMTSDPPETVPPSPSSESEKAP